MFSLRACVCTGEIMISFIALTAHINPKQAEYWVCEDAEINIAYCGEGFQRNTKTIWITLGH